MQGNEEVINELLERIKKIETALIGDKDFKHMGLVDKYHDLDERLSILEEFKRKIYWQVTSVAGFSALIVQLILQIKNFFR